MDLSKQERLQQRLAPEINEFREKCQTLQLSTLDENQCPNASYAPFVFVDGDYYVLISQIARHARNLLVNNRVSLMMIEDEGVTRNLFARKRLTFDACATVIDRDQDEWAMIIKKMHDRFGDIIENLSGLEDFVLFRLQAEQGLFVKGFGKAFRVSVNDSIDTLHLTQGHRRIQDGTEITVDDFDK